jgi:BASS family bile acid:Na+ symporter
MNELLLNLSRWSMLAFLLASMLELGLRLTPAEVLAPLKNSRNVSVSLVANFLMVPLLAFGIAKLVRLEEPFAIGLLLLALAPGAPFIPKIVQLARGNLAFATGLMVLLMAGTVIVLPLLLPRIVSGIEVNAGQIAKSLLLTMLLPLFVGLAVHGSVRSLPARLIHFLGLISNLSGLVVLVLVIALNLKSVLSVFGTGAIFAGLLFVLLSFATGWLLAGPDRGIRAALGLGTASRNVAAALLVGAQNFKDPRVNVMVVVTALASLLILLPTANALGRRSHPPADSSLKTLTSPTAKP